MKKVILILSLCILCLWAASCGAEIESSTENSLAAEASSVVSEGTFVQDDDSAAVSMESMFSSADPSGTVSAGESVNESIPADSSDEASIDESAEISGSISEVISEDSSEGDEQPVEPSDDRISEPEISRAENSVAGSSSVDEPSEPEVSKPSDPVPPPKPTTGWAGSGTEKDPFLISTKADLDLLAKYKETGKYFKQTADIALSGSWTPIGTESKPFRNHYDGAGHKITGIKVTAEDNELFGFFGCAKEVTIQNLTVEGAAEGFSQVGLLIGSAFDCNVINCHGNGTVRASSEYAGGLIGRFSSENNKKSPVIRNCSFSGTVSGGEYTGGLIGKLSGYDDYSSEKGNVTVSGCSSSAKVDGTYDDAGGLIGFISYSNIRNCYATGDVHGERNNNGGLIGEAYSWSEISECFATGNVSDTGTFSYGNAFVGGLVGRLYSTTKLHDCYATGNVSAVCTWSDCQDRISYNGGVWVNYRNPVGSLVGCVYVSGNKINVYNCYATGTVTAPKICTWERTYCNGSLIGWVYDDYTRKHVIDTSIKDLTDGSNLSETMVGKITGNYCVSTLRDYFRPMGNLIYNSSRTAVIEEYTMPTFKYVNNITSSQLTETSTFEGWDFSGVWKMGSKGPELRKTGN